MILLVVSFGFTLVSFYSFSFSSVVTSIVFSLVLLQFFFCYVLPLCSFGYIQAVGSNDAAICICFITSQ